jgi:NAD-dependent dihydropyrimidine dehydrogenase PreA subunit
MKLEYFKNVASLKLENAEKCSGCGMCISVCPHGVFKLENSKVQIINKNACMECGACKINCPLEIIKVNSGVGCAAAIINGLLSNSEPSCDCGGTKKKQSACCG